MSRRRVAAAWVLVVTAIVGSAYLYQLDPEAPGRYPSCPFRLLTGLLCPGCGTLRMLHDAMHLRLAQAAAHNPVSLAAIPLMIWALCNEAAIAIRRRPLQQVTIPARVSWLIAPALVLFAVARNLLGAT